MSVPPMADARPVEDDPVVRDLAKYGESLRPDPATAGRIRARARAAYLERYHAAARMTVDASATFFGRRVPTVLLGILLFAAAFGDVKLCAGLSMFGFGTLLSTASTYSAPYLLIGTLVIVAAVLELVFAFGLWARRDWALPLGIGVEVASIGLSAAWVLAGAALPLQLLSALVSFAVLSALAQAAVRAALRNHEPVLPRRLEA
jgi:hypothetical protein